MIRSPNKCNDLKKKNCKAEGRCAWNNKKKKCKYDKNSQAGEF